MINTGKSHKCLPAFCGGVFPKQKSSQQPIRAFEVTSQRALESYYAHLIKKWLIASSYRSIWLAESHGFSRPPIYVERQNQCTCELLSKLNWKLLVQSIRLRTIHWWLEDDSSLEQQLEHNGTCCCLNPWNDDRGNMTFEMAISVFHHNDYNLLTNQRNEFHFAIFLRPQNSFRLQNSNVLIIS